MKPPERYPREYDAAEAAPRVQPDGVTHARAAYSVAAGVDGLDAVEYIRKPVSVRLDIRFPADIPPATDENHENGGRLSVWMITEMLYMVLRLHALESSRYKYAAWLLVPPKYPIPYNVRR